MDIIVYNLIRIHQLNVQVFVAMEDYVLKKNVMIKRKVDVNLIV